MEKELKKDIFLLILSTIFNDYTKDINGNNCIKFYHFLIDTLDREVVAMPDENEDDIAVCFSIIELLCNFDIIDDGQKAWTHDTILLFLINYSGLNLHEFDNSLVKFRKIYSFIKEDFILGLT